MPTRFLALSHQEKLTRGQTRNPARPSGGPLQQRGTGREHTAGSLARPLPWCGRGAVSFLTWADGWRACPGVRSQDGLGGVPPSPAGGVECMGHAQYPLPVFAPDSPELAADVFVFCFCLCIFWVQNFPQLHMQAVFLVPCSFLVSCCWRRGVSRHVPRFAGPSS